MRVPRIIWTLWLQGWDQAPAVASACLKTWQTHSRNWTLHALTQRTVENFIETTPIFSVIDPKRLPPEALSDIIRVALLRRYGGVWVDSTAYCLRPLDEWLPENTGDGFFAFSNPGPDRMLSSWFLAAEKGNYIIEKWSDLSQHYWTNRLARDDYFWFHYLFAECYRKDVLFRKAWDRAPKVSADGPHYYIPYESKLTAPATAADHTILALPSVPLLKLTHKLQPSDPTSQSVLSFLIAQANKQTNKVIDVHPHREMYGPKHTSQSDAKPRRLLVGWYGSFGGHGTIGDFLSMQSVVSHLVGTGYDVYHASSEPWCIPGSRRADWRDISLGSIDALVFACGPILKQHPEMQALFSRFERVPRIGVGVSIMPSESLNFCNPFNHVLAREGLSKIYEDVAIVAPPQSFDMAMVRDEQLNVGICLRGPQHEYGSDLCLWEHTEMLARQTAHVLARKYGARVHQIENNLLRSKRSPAQIESQYRECDLIITSRFHGAMLALRHLVPFIAIDQIQGGAKVNNLVSATGWPHVYNAESIDHEQVAHVAESLLLSKQRDALFEIRCRTISRANVTLEKLLDVVLAAGIK